MSIMSDRLESFKVSNSALQELRRYKRSNPKDFVQIQLYALREVLKRISDNLPTDTLTHMPSIIPHFIKQYYGCAELCGGLDDFFPCRIYRNTDPFELMITTPYGSMVLCDMTTKASILESINDVSMKNICASIIDEAILNAKIEHNEVPISAHRDISIGDTSTTFVVPIVAELPNSIAHSEPITRCFTVGYYALDVVTLDDTIQDLHYGYCLIPDHDDPNAIYDRNALCNCYRIAVSRARQLSWHSIGLEQHGECCSIDILTLDALIYGKMCNQRSEQSRCRNAHNEFYIEYHIPDLMRQLHRFHTLAAETYIKVIGSKIRMVSPIRKCVNDLSERKWNDN